MSSQESWARVVRAAQDPDGIEDRDSVLTVAVALGVGAETLACSLTELAGGGARTVAWSGAAALPLDEAQYAAGVGPCLSAARAGTVHHVVGAGELARYPEFAAVAHRHGVESSLSVPLVDVRWPAALNFYAATPDAFGAARSRAEADLLARCVSRLLPSGQSDQRVSPAAVAAALSQGDTIRRAQDTLTAQHGVSRQDALLLMIRRSQLEQRSIKDVAEDVCGGAGTEAAS